MFSGSFWFGFTWLIGYQARGFECGNALRRFVLDLDNRELAGFWKDDLAKKSRYDVEELKHYWLIVDKKTGERIYFASFTET